MSGDDQSMTTNTAGWNREMREVSAGVFRITIRDPTGYTRYSATGTDQIALMDEAGKWLRDTSARQLGS